MVGELVEAFEKVEPEILWGETPFTGKHYTYLGNGVLQLKNSRDGVEKTPTRSWKRVGEGLRSRESYCRAG